MSFARYVRVGKVELFLEWNGGKADNRCYLGGDPDTFEVWVGPLYISINKVRNPSYGYVADLLHHHDPQRVPEAGPGAADADCLGAHAYRSETGDLLQGAFPADRSR